MATKAKTSNPLNGMHTAGIFSDMSIDGPEIGTLVLIVDRAKNLPNRKTIGKQDPYCAARLGKEAKKTSTDIRGGQTPKWDQELRFTVNDSPDYYQLKLSVFNDDKKTELIGETWIDLRDIIVQGGGQSDEWHGLNCKGKYAGNIRIEITYYDSRPKPEKPAAKPRPVASSSELNTTATTTPTQRQVVKRRPLPSDPVTGQAPPRAPEPASVAPPRVHSGPPNGHMPSQPPSIPPAEHHTPPPNRRIAADPYPHAQSAGYQYSTSPAQRDYHPQREVQRLESYHNPQYDTDPFYQPDPAQPRLHEADGRPVYNDGHPNYSTQSLPVQIRRSMENERPPPPPAHKIRNSSGHSPDPNTMHRGSLDMVQHKATPPMRHDVLRNEAHRYSGPPPAAAPASASAYPGRPTYRPYDSAPDLQDSPHHGEYDQSLSTPRHHSYDSSYEAHHRAMQPTVEDVPESWTPPQIRTRSSISQYDEPVMDPAASQTSLVIAGRGSLSHEQHTPSHPQPQTPYDGYRESSSAPPMPTADYSQALTHVPRAQTYQVDRYQTHPSEMENRRLSGIDYGPPAVPSTLVPGMNSNIPREVSEPFPQERTHERRYTQPSQMVVHYRGRQHSEPPSHYAANYSPHHQHTSSRAYERAPVAYSGGPNTPAAAAESSDLPRLSPSPSANHTIRRKSVSPAPPPSEARRSSGVPFGPDSYDAFNPSVTKEDSKSGDYTNAYGKIVTHDGREVDPSDHLPMDTWAPEPEPKHSIPPPSETRSRAVPGGAQPMPPSGRRQLRIAARPQSMAVTPPALPAHEPSEPSSTGRNRLQKRNHRMSASPAPISASSSPLGPASAHQRNSTPPRALVRAGTFDYENHGPAFDSHFGTARTGYGSGPPIPAKVPMMSGGLGPSAYASRGSEESALMEEMSRIDIGTGRARRHGGY